MKKLAIIALSLVLVTMLASIAIADPKTLPAGSLVTADCNSDNTATVHVTGVTVESMEKYFYFLPEQVITTSPAFVVFNLDEGRRFNFTFDNGYYAGISKEMAKRYGYPASFLGANIDVDSSNVDGSAFIITCPSVVARK